MRGGYEPRGLEKLYQVMQEHVIFQLIGKLEAYKNET